MAQNVTIAVCDAESAWFDNSEKQTPCLVAAYLLGACNASGTIADIPPLLDGENYPVPTQSTANDCQCSSVVYNLMSACALCQLHDSISSWADWNTSCAGYSVSPGNYTRPIPSGIAVPGWAYITPDAMGGTFNGSEIRQSDLNLTESAALPTPTSTNSSSTYPISTSANPPAQTNVTSAGSGKSPKVGAIAGGVIGGALVIAIICIVALVRIKRSQKSRIAPSVAFSMGNYGSSPPVSRLSYPAGQYSPVETPLFLDPSRYRVTPESAPDSDSGFGYSPPQNPSLLMPQPQPVGAQAATNPFIQRHPFNPYGGQAHSPV